MNYKELEVWLETRNLSSLIYTISYAFPKEEIYGLINQMRRCAISIPSNIAEGYGRQTSKNTIHFLHIFRGSLYELETQFYVALNQKYLLEKYFTLIIGRIETCKKILNGFINYYKKI